MRFARGPCPPSTARIAPRATHAGKEPGSQRLVGLARTDQGVNFHGLGATGRVRGSVVQLCRGSGKPRLVYPGARLVSDEREHAGGGVVVVVYLDGGLAGVGPQDSSDVLDEAAFERDGCGEEEGVECRAVEALANVGAGRND